MVHYITISGDVHTLPQDKFSFYFFPEVCYDKRADTLRITDVTAGFFPFERTFAMLFSKSERIEKHEQKR